MNDNGYKPPPKPGFIVKMEHSDMYNNMTDAEAGKLLKAMIEYTRTEVEVILEDSTANFAFSCIKGGLDNDTIKYKQKCHRNWENSQNRRKPDS